MGIWIDIKTGSWGDESGLVIIPKPSEEMLEKLNDASDSEICEIGKEALVRLEGLLIDTTA